MSLFTRFRKARTASATDIMTTTITIDPRNKEREMGGQSRTCSTTPAATKPFDFPRDNTAFGEIIFRDRKDLVPFRHAKTNGGLQTTRTRVIKELRAMASSIPTEPDPAFNISYRVLNDDIFQGLATIAGRPGSVYEGGVFFLRVTLDEGQYPQHPPKMRFLTPIYHPNISSNGGICADWKTHWSPVLTIEKTVLMIAALLEDPGIDDPLMPDIAKLFTTNRAQYDENARLYTQAFATGEYPDEEELRKPYVAPTWSQMMERRDGYHDLK